jgi:hypothetical protein
MRLTGRWVVSTRCLLPPPFDERSDRQNDLTGGGRQTARLPQQTMNPWHENPEMSEAICCPQCPQARKLDLAPRFSDLIGQRPCAARKGRTYDPHRSNVCKREFLRTFCF